MTPQAALRAPPAAPRRAPRRPAPAPPPLRLVEDGHRGRRRRTAAQRRRVTVAVTTLLVVLGLFGLAAFQAVLVQGQARLDRLQRDVAAEQQRYERLRAHVAELEAPGRVVAAARERLGMVPPEDVTWVTVPRPAPAEPPAGGDPASVTETWAAVKPHLTGRP